MPRNPGGHAVRHDVADRCRRRNQHRVPGQHHVDAFPVDEIAVLDRVDARRGRPFDALRAMGMGVGSFPGGVGFFHRGPHLRHGELRIADVGARGEDSAAGNELDVVGAGLDLLARRTPDLVGAIDLPA